MSFQKTRKSVSCLTTFFLLFSSFAWADPGVTAIPASGEDSPRLIIPLPAGLGKTNETYLPSASGRGPLVFHIQTAHGNYEGALKIREIIRYLRRRYGVKLLLAEGANDVFCPEFLQFFQDPKLNLQMADRLAQKGYLTGLDLSLLDPSGQIDSSSTARGVESPHLYIRTFQHFKTVLSSREESRRWVESRERELNRRASKIFTKEFRELVENWRKFRLNRRDLSATIKFLQGKALDKLHLNLRDPLSQFAWPNLTRLVFLTQIEERRDPSALREEKRRLAEWLKTKAVDEKWIRAFDGKSERLREGLSRNFFTEFLAEVHPLGFKFQDYPQVTYEAAFEVARSELDSHLLFAEFETLFHELFQDLAKGGKELRLVREHEKLLLIQKLLSLELTREEWERIKALNVRPLASQLPLTAAIHFYQLAERREQFFVRNIKRAMERQRARKAILVTGGFHSEGLYPLFRKEGIGYASMAPQVSGPIDHSLYRDAMLGLAHLEQPELPHPARLGDSDFYRLEFRHVNEIARELDHAIPASSPYQKDRLAFLNSASPSQVLAPRIKRSEVRSAPEPKFLNRRDFLWAIKIVQFPWGEAVRRIQLLPRISAEEGNELAQKGGLVFIPIEWSDGILRRLDLSTVRQALRRRTFTVAISGWVYEVGVETGNAVRISKEIPPGRRIRRWRTLETFDKTLHDYLENIFLFALFDFANVMRKVEEGEIHELELAQMFDRHVLQRADFRKKWIDVWNLDRTFFRIFRESGRVFDSGAEEFMINHLPLPSVFVTEALLRAKFAWVHSKQVKENIYSRMPVLQLPSAEDKKWLKDFSNLRSEMRGRRDRAAATVFRRSGIKNFPLIVALTLMGGVWGVLLGERSTFWGMVGAVTGFFTGVIASQIREFLKGKVRLSLDERLARQVSARLFVVPSLLMNAYELADQRLFESFSQDKLKEFTQFGALGVLEDPSPEAVVRAAHRLKNAFPELYDTPWNRNLLGLIEGSPEKFLKEIQKLQSRSPKILVPAFVIHSARIPPGLRGETAVRELHRLIAHERFQIVLLTNPRFQGFLESRQSQLWVNAIKRETLSPTERLDEVSRKALISFYGELRLRYPDVSASEILAQLYLSTLPGEPAVEGGETVDERTIDLAREALEHLLPRMKWILLARLRRNAIRRTERDLAALIKTGLNEVFGFTVHDLKVLRSEVRTEEVGTAADLLRDLTAMDPASQENIAAILETAERENIKDLKKDWRGLAVKLVEAIDRERQLGRVDEILRIAGRSDKIAKAVLGMLAAELNQPPRNFKAVRILVYLIHRIVQTFPNLDYVAVTSALLKALELVGAAEEVEAASLVSRTFQLIGKGSAAGEKAVVASLAAKIETRPNLQTLSRLVMVTGLLDFDLSLQGIQFPYEALIPPLVKTALERRLNPQVFSAIALLLNDAIMSSRESRFLFEQRIEEFVFREGYREALSGRDKIQHFRGAKGWIARKMPTLVEIMSSPERVERFLRVLSLLRKMDGVQRAIDTSSLAPLQYAERHKDYFKIKELRITSASQSFRRHIVYTQEGRSTFAIELKIPGEFKDRDEIGEMNFRVAVHMRNRDGEDSNVVRPLFYYTRQAEDKPFFVSMYGKRIRFRRYPLGVVAFVYKDGKRLMHTPVSLQGVPGEYTFLSLGYLKRVARENGLKLRDLMNRIVVETIAAVLRLHMAGYEGLADMHLGNVRLGLDGTTEFVGDFGNYEKVAPLSRGQLADMRRIKAELHLFLLEVMGRPFSFRRQLSRLWPRIFEKALGREVDPEKAKRLVEAMGYELDIFPSTEEIKRVLEKMSSRSEMRTVMQVAHRWTLAEGDAFRYALAFELGGFEDTRWPVELRKGFPRFLEEAIQVAALGGQNPARVQSWMKNLRDAFQDGVGIAPPAKRSASQTPIILQVDAKAIDPGEESIRSEVRTELRKRLSRLPQGSVVVVYSDASDRSSADLFSDLMREFPLLYYERRTYLGRLDLGEVGKVRKRWERRAGIGTEHSGFLFSNSKLLDSPERMGEAGVAFQVDLQNLSAPYRMLRGVLGATAFGELAEHVKLDREIRDRVLAENRARGVLGLSGGFHAFDLDQLLAARSERALLASA